MQRKPDPDDAVADIELAYGHLKTALGYLKTAGATKAATRVRLALSSCKGAQRNADNRVARAKRQP